MLAISVLFQEALDFGFEIVWIKGVGAGTRIVQDLAFGAEQVDTSWLSCPGIINRVVHGVDQQEAESPVR